MQATRSCSPELSWINAAPDELKNHKRSSAGLCAGNCANISRWDWFCRTALSEHAWGQFLVLWWHWMCWNFCFRKVWDRFWNISVVTSSGRHKHSSFPFNLSCGLVFPRAVVVFLFWVWGGTAEFSTWGWRAATPVLPWALNSFPELFPGSP